MTTTSSSPPLLSKLPPADDGLLSLRLQLREADGSWCDVHQADAWRADWSVSEDDSRRVTLTRPDGQPVGAVELQCIVQLPLLNYGGVVIPDCGRHYVNSPKALDIRAPQFQITAANAGHPFFAVNDEAGAFLLAVGLLNVPGAVTIRRLLPGISQRKAMIGGDQHLALAFAWTHPEPADEQIELDLFVSTTADHWFTALRNYTDLIRQREELLYPRHSAAWEPVWCTWTAFPSAQMNDQRVLDNARLAKELGMGALILDDGWFGPGLDDDGPRPINHGDYAADAAKFADLPRLVRQVQEQGLKFLLWHAPLCVAPTSKVAQRLAHWFMRDATGDFLSVNGLHQLCPACPQVRAYVQAETRRLFEQFGIDGLKVDLFNCLSPQPCTSTTHDHDIADPVAALDALMAAQWEAARAANPQALLELKQDYGNARLIRHGTMVRAGDTAYDMDTNLQRCGYTQAFAECVHVDPLVTSIHTRPIALALMMIKALAGGVPTFSMNLPDLSAAQRQVLAAWLGFYRQQRALFQSRRRPLGRKLEVWQGGGPAQWWLAAVMGATEVPLPEGEIVHLLNGTDRTQLYPLLPQARPARLRLFDYRLQLQDERTLTLEPGGSLPVLPGGLTEIHHP